MKISFINDHFKRIWLKHKDEFLERLNKLGESGQWILGEEVSNFEKSFAEFVGTKYAVGVCCGTHAIMLALRALNIKGNVALPSHTFKATCSAVLDAGAKPALYDMDGLFQNSWPKLDSFIQVHISGEIQNNGNVRLIKYNKFFAIRKV
ncbi:MAG: DegT/DnrJ/EryC1/StrS family aminotransferase [Nanoarchaeota archaeon]